MELVLEAAYSAIGPLRLTCVRAVKFVAPLHPGQAADLHLEWDGQRIRFRCERDGALLAQGNLEYAAPA